MAFPSNVTLATQDRVSLARIPVGNTLPTALVVESDNLAAAGAASLTLSLATVDGVAAGGGDSAVLEHDSELLMPANSTLAVDGTPALGSYTLDVDDGSDALPANLIAVGDYFTIAGDDQLYLATDRIAGAAEYTIRTYPELKAAPADNAAITVYNRVRLNLPGATRFVSITSTGAAVAVTGVTYAMDAAAASRTAYEMRQLLGVATVNPSPEVASTEVANMKFRTTLRGTTSYSLAVDGQLFPGNAGYNEIALPYLTDPDREAEGNIYFEYVSARGLRVRDTGSITESGGTAAVDEPDGYNLTITATKGDNFEQWIR